MLAFVLPTGCMTKPVVVFLVAVLLLAISVLFLVTLQRNTVIPHSLKLTDCTNTTVECQLRLPKGRSYYLVLATPGAGMALTPLFPFSGDVDISRGAASLIHFPIGSGLAQQCNWLERAGIPYSYALTGPWNTNCPRLDRLFHGGNDYSIRIVFSQSPPSSTSIWLHWLQAGKDRS